MDEIKEKKILIERINTDIDDILFWRKTYVDESNLPFEEVVEIRLLICRLWLKYYTLSHIYKNKP